MSQPTPLPVSLALCVGAVLGSMLVLAAPSQAGQDPVVRLAVQKTGTVSWELDVVRRHGLDRAEGVTIETVDLASAEGGRLALRGGSADVFVTDWLWVARERALGDRVQFSPYSSAVGGVMVPAASAVANLSELTGKSLAVSGGPLDKSWLLVRAAAAQDGLDLKAQTRPVYGAPPLLYEKTLQGEVDASLTYWNFAARLEAQGFRRIFDVAEAERRLGAAGPVAMVGYVFDESWAKAHPDALNRFLEAARKAREILATSDAEWDAIAPLTGAPDKATLLVMRDRYRAGIPRRAAAEEEADAARLFAVLARVGGPDLVGDSKTLPPGVFYGGSAP